MPASIVPMRRRSDATVAIRRDPGGSSPPHDPGSADDLGLLALLLGGGDSGAELACALLERFRDLHGIERASASDLTLVGGIGPGRAAALQAAIALGRRAACRERSRGDRIRSSSDAHRRLSPALRHLEREVFMVLLLDNRHRVLREVRVAEGGLTACAVQPRDVLQPAVREGAAAVIFVHNHPSGDPTPSNEDPALTRRLCVASEALGIRALDHLIVGDGRYVSLSDRGLMGRAS